MSPVLACITLLAVLPNTTHTLTQHGDGKDWFPFHDSIYLNFLNMAADPASIWYL